MLMFLVLGIFIKVVNGESPYVGKVICLRSFQNSKYPYMNYQSKLKWQDVTQNTIWLEVRLGFDGQANTVSFFNKGMHRYINGKETGQKEVEFSGDESNKDRGSFLIHENYAGINGVIAIEWVSSSFPNLFITRNGDNTYVKEFDSIHSYFTIMIKDVDSYELSQTLHYAIPDPTSVVVGWSLFYDYETVRVYHKDADVNGSTYGPPVEVSKDDHGAEVTGLTSETFYEFAVEFENATGDIVKSIPVYIMTSSSGSRLQGVYDLILKATPTIAWKRQNVMWKYVKQSHLSYDNFIHSGLDDKDLVSPYKEEKYENYLLGMRESGQPIDWIMLNHKLETFRKIITLASSFSNKYSEFVSTFGLNDPDYGDPYNSNSGVYVDGFSYGVTYGTVKEHISESLEYTFGLGISHEPYVGVLELGGDEEKKPMYGYLLGHTELHTGSFSYTCTYDNEENCGYGINVPSHMFCQFDHPNWINKFCPLPRNRSCHERECKFPAPENLTVSDRDSYNIHLRWNQYNSSNLIQPSSFVYFQIMYSRQGFSDTWTAYAYDVANDQIRMGGLQPYTNYSFIIQGYSGYGGVYGQESEPVYGRTLAAVPTASPQFRTVDTVNSSCIYMEWIPVDEANLRGPFVGYELSYDKTDAGGEHGRKIQLEEVENYTLCGLQAFRNYRISISVSNSDFQSSQTQYNIQTGEGVPSMAPQFADMYPYALAKDEIQVTWDEMSDFLHWNGVPVKYYVFFREAGYTEFMNVSFTTDILTTTLSDLNSYTLYEISLAAATAVGIGTLCNITIIRTLEDVPLASATNVTAEAVNSSSVKIYWDEVGDKLRRGVVLNYTVYLYQVDDESKNFTKVVAGDQFDVVIGGLESYTLYEVKIFCNNSVGAGPFTNASNVRTTFGVPKYYPLITDGQNTSSTSLYVRWNNISLYGWGGLAGRFQVTAVSVEDPSDSHELVVDNGESETFEGHISGLKFFTRYNIFILLQNDAGNGPSSPPYSILTDEAVPVVGPNITDATTTGPHSINIQWIQILNNEWEGYPHVYKVTHRKIGSSEKGSTVFSHSVSEGEIEGLESYTDYEFTIHAGTVKGFGPSGNMIVQKTGEDYPIGSARNASGTFIDSSSIVVYWATVKEDEQKGPILSYTITCYSTDFLQNFGSVTVMENEDKAAEFSGLEVYTLYAVNISATNSIGTGPDISILVRTEGEEPVVPPKNIHGHNTSASSIKIYWEDLEDVEWAGYAGDFRLEIINSKNRSDQNVTNITRVVPPGELMYEIKNLFPYTFYKIRMLAFNFKGDSPFSEVVNIQTAESAPSASPVDVACRVTSFSSITIIWGNVSDSEQLNGVRRGCYVYIQPVYTGEDLEIGNTGVSRRKRRSASNSQTYTVGLALNETIIDVPYGNDFNANGLRGNTLYNVSVAFYTVAVGVASAPVQVLTPESVPTISVVNFVCTTISYNAIMLTWQHAPPAYMQGVRTKYTVFYERNGLILNDTLNPYKEHYEVMFLKSDSEYSIWIVAATAVGYGNQSEKLNCQTFETEPTAAPTMVTASSFESPYSSLIEWEHIPDQSWEGSKVGYLLFYQKEATGEVEESYPRYFKTFETGYQTSVELTGLEVYARYRVQIAARTNVGYGPKSDFVYFETCHVPHPNLIMNYAVYPPYIDYPVNNSVNRPEGIMVNLAEAAVLHCAHYCKSFSRPVNITYVNTEVPYFANISDLQYNGSVLQIPRRDPGKFTPSYSRIAITNSPGFVLIEVPDSPTEAAAKGEDSLLDGIIATIPLCGFYLILNWLFGAIFWFCEPTEVEYKGTFMSLGGLFEGLYLAFMTSTTVGYGDKIPMTNRGRVYIIFWTLLGLVLTGIVVGNLSSALSAGAINALAQKLPDDKVLALYGTTEYTYGKKSIKKFDKNVSYYTYEDVLAPLARKDIKYALIDRNIMEILKSNVTEYGLEVNTVFNFETEFGIAAFGELEKLKICGSKYAKANLDVVSKDISALLEKLAKLEAAKKAAGGSTEETEDDSNEGESPPELISWRAPLYQKAVLYLVILWVAFNIIGISYEIHRRYKLMKLRKRIHTQIDLRLALQEDLRKFKCELLESFQELIDRMEEKTEEMLYQHCKQLIDMRNEMSKLYGINFKYIKTSDLGIPLEKILEYREDIKNRPKEKIDIGRAISRRTVTIRHYLGRLIRWFIG